MGRREGTLEDLVKAWKGRRVFLTGHTGFKGSWLALWLGKLGAQSGGVQWLVVRQGMALTLIAVALGLSAAWAVAHLMSSFLYGVPPHDPVTFTVVPLFLASVALLACWLPALRAARVDPLTALRHE